MSNRPDLSVVIPVHNAVATIGTLVETLLSCATIDLEVITVDDCSHDGSTEILRELACEPSVVASFLTTNGGAGQARNAGFGLATGRYTLFFDADDEIHLDAARRGINVLDRTGCRTALFQYRYRRPDLDGDDAMNLLDQVIWDAYVGDADMRVVELDAVARLLGFSNYPWNKIIRTDPYRDQGLRFGSTPVNNDILGHWMTLLGADRIALVNEVLCTHEVTSEGTNLTNRHDRVRLSLFDALDETYDYLQSFPHLRRRYAHHYWDLVLRVTGWAEHRLQDDVLHEYRIRRRNHLLRIDLSDFAGMRMKRDPALGERIVRAAFS